MKDTPVKKTAVKKTAVKKTPAVKTVAKKKTVEPVVEHKPKSTPGKYVFATGRRKTAVANIRLFEDGGDNLVNKKPLSTYFSHKSLVDITLQAFQITGLAKDYHFSADIHGGGIHSQAEALRQALARALMLKDTELRRVLKKNGLLTRDDRKKERKKPGLRRARRAPQWAKR